MNTGIILVTEKFNMQHKTLVVRATPTATKNKHSRDPTCVTIIQRTCMPGQSFAAKNKIKDKDK